MVYSLSMFSRFVALTLALPLAAAAAPVDYAKQVQPLFEEHCTDCHAGGDADGELAVDTFAALLKGGKTGKAFEAGKAQDSLLVKFLEGRSGKTGKNQFMPPGKKEHLKPEQIAMIRQWIDEGAHGPGAASPPTNPLAKVAKVPTKTTIRPTYSIAASADGKLIALGRFESVELIDGMTRKSLRVLQGLSGKAYALRFSADAASLFVAAGDDGIAGMAYQYNTADGKLVRSFSGHADALYAVAISPDGKQLATGGYDQKIKLWDIASGKEITTIKGHNGCINSLAYRPDGKVLASASADRTVKLWDTAKGERLDTFSQPLKEQLTVVFSADGKTVIAAGADSRLRQWRVSDKAIEGSNALLETKFAHEGVVLALAISPDGKSLLSSASDQTVKLWDASTLANRQQFTGQSDWANGIAWLSNERALATRLNGSTSVLEVASGKTEPLVAAAPPTKIAKPAVPTLAKLEPRGFQSGVETVITATGTGLTAIKAIKTSDARVVAKVVEAKGTTLTFKLSSPKDLPRASYEVSVVTPNGETSKLMLYADDVPQAMKPMVLDLGISSYDVWGTLTTNGHRDDHRFKAKAGETVVLDLAAKRVGSKAQTIQLELLDASGHQLAANHGLDAGTDPLIAFEAKESGEFIARVSETTLEGSANHVYRLTICNQAYVTGWWPLSVPVNAETSVELIGYNLRGAKLKVHPTTRGTVPLPGLAPATRFRQALTVLATDMPEIIESEPNDTLEQAKKVMPPVSINGRMFIAKDEHAADADVYAFDAKAGEQWMIETLADKAGAPTDTRLEVLDAKGEPVERVRLQAVRSSFNNFRSVDADNQDIRLENYTETGLNEFVYFNGDVMKTFRVPRGPDGGFFFYTSNGKRRAYFDTTATAHSLDEPCYVVEPLKQGDAPLPNGLPVLSLPYANDDDGLRMLGSDSRLHFTAPATAKYLVRVTDARGWSGKRFAYRLVIRKPAPDFAVKLNGEKSSVGAGSAMGFSLRADRKDDFEDAITVKIEGLPQGWYASSPIVIEAGHTLASGSLFAAADATKEGDWTKVKITATSGSLTHEVNGFGKVMLAAKPKFIANLLPASKDRPVARTSSQPQVITITPGQIVNAFIVVERNGNDGILNFDVHALPHGIIVDDIGLNGIQVREKETEREIRFACAKWVQPQERLIHATVSSARNEADSAGLATSFPVLLRVVKDGGISQR